MPCQPGLGWQKKAVRLLFHHLSWKQHETGWVHPMCFWLHWTERWRLSVLPWVWCLCFLHEWHPVWQPTMLSEHKMGRQIKEMPSKIHNLPGRQWQWQWKRIGSWGAHQAGLLILAYRPSDLTPSVKLCHMFIVEICFLKILLLSVQIVKFLTVQAKTTARYLCSKWNAFCLLKWKKDLPANVCAMK